MYISLPYLLSFEFCKTVHKLLLLFAAWLHKQENGALQPVWRDCIKKVAKYSEVSHEGRLLNQKNIQSTVSLIYIHDKLPKYVPIPLTNCININEQTYLSIQAACNNLPSFNYPFLLNDHLKLFSYKRSYNLHTICYRYIPQI